MAELVFALLDADLEWPVDRTTRQMPPDRIQTSIDQDTYFLGVESLLRIALHVSQDKVYDLPVNVAPRPQQIVRTVRRQRSV